MPRIAISAIALAVFSATTGCGEFELPSIVLDLRILAMQVEPPEIVIEFDPENLPQSPSDIQIDDIQVCALVADPADSRGLEFVMSACAPTETLRCDGPERPFTPVGQGMVGDPEDAGQPVTICGTLVPDIRLFNVLQDAVENDSLSGFGGVAVLIDLAVFPAGSDIDHAEWAAKRMLFAPRIPAERVANRNPSLDELHITREGGEEISAPLGRCGDIAPVTASPGEKLDFEPVETEGARENYVVPTFEGGSRMFTENLTYSWYASTGKWQREISGGPIDFAGNEPPLDSKWTAPEEVTAAGQDVRFWLVQRDERGGLKWYETCVHVAP